MPPPPDFASMASSAGLLAIFLTGAGFFASRCFLSSSSRSRCACSKGFNFLAGTGFAALFAASYSAFSFSAY